MLTVTRERYTFDDGVLPRSPLGSTRVRVTGDVTGREREFRDEGINKDEDEVDNESEDDLESEAGGYDRC